MLTKVFHDKENHENVRGMLGRCCVRYGIGLIADCVKPTTQKYSTIIVPWKSIDEAVESRFIYSAAFTNSPFIKLRELC